ncbi:MAG: hypothetical protein ACLP0J_25750 [Solirubrobacteraceae bacterium]
MSLGILDLDAIATIDFEDVSKDRLIGFIVGAVEPGTTSHTDGW